MGQFSEQITTLVARAAVQQAGIISGDNPTAYNAGDPLRLWVIQVGIIIVFTQLLSLLFSRIRQPRVIAEVIGGVLLGPSVMGRIPNFTRRIFPAQSIPLLTLTANIGLVFFLFLIGLEIDTRIIKRNAKAALAISAAGLILPFGLGAALAVPIYHEFINKSVNYGFFILFVAVAIGITAFPVLCRILTELQLLDTTVGVVTLAAGVGNDVVGWIFLALTVTLVNATSGLAALWVLLSAIAYIIFLLYPVRLAFVWLARKTGSLENGQPSTLMMTLTLLLVLLSALFTDIIGIHPIFGAFVTGLIIPHEGGFAIAMVEKLEDFIKLVFLPIYFTLSGLNTNLGLLNTGKTWGYTILICVVAFFGKFVGCFFAARFTGFNVRESGAIGSLMSCKGLVELIVLNVGFQAGILDVRSFSMFVLHAIILTSMTTPLVLMWYPAKYRVHQGPFLDRPKPNVIDPTGLSNETFVWKSRFAVAFSSIEQLPALMSFAQLLRSNSSASMDVDDESEVKVDEKRHSFSPLPSVTIHTLRLVELTDRTSAVLRSQEASEPTILVQDPLITVFRSFAHLQRIVVRAALRVVSPDEFSHSVTNFAITADAQLVVIPWAASRTASLAFDENSHMQASPSNAVTAIHAPLGDFFRAGDRVQFIRKVFADSSVDVALYVEQSSLPTHVDSQSGESKALPFGDTHHIFLPFFGGPDDRQALSFVVQLCTNPKNTATIVRITSAGKGTSRDPIDDEKLNMHSGDEMTASNLGPDTVYGDMTNQSRLLSDTADNILWAKCTQLDDSQQSSARRALRRITFRECSTPTPLRTMIDLAKNASRGERDLSQHVRTDKGDRPAAVIVAGRSRRMANEANHKEFVALASERGTGPVGLDIAKTMGDVAAAIIASQIETNLFVIQAAIGTGDNF